MPYYWANGGVTALATGIAAAATSADVTDAAVLPGSFPYLLQLWDAGTYANPNNDAGMEIVKVTAASGNTLTIERAQDGTSDQTHSAGQAAANNLVAVGLNWAMAHYGTSLMAVTDDYTALDLDTGSEVAVALNATNALCNQIIAILTTTLLGNE